MVTRPAHPTVETSVPPAEAPGRVLGPVGFPVSPALDLVSRAILDAGGRPVVVGGAVRDHLLGHAAKDIDLEVSQLSLDALERVLHRVGDVHAVGRSFGVFKVDVNDAGKKETFDVALPRTESKSGRGHRGFVVESDAFLPFPEAARRRDFTMNAMGVDLEDGALLDPWGGVADLESRTLRHVSAAFDEDPLRVLRACQFAARFLLTIAPETVVRCLALNDELSTLPVERLWEEMKKLLVRSPFPSVGLAALRETGAVSLFPEIESLVGVPQEPEWHPEGDVWVHTLMVVDEAAMVAREEELDDDETLILTLAALAHDFGKPLTTKFENGRMTSKDHESYGREPTERFLARIGASHAVIDAVVPLVADHLKPWQLYAARDLIKDGALRRLALRVSIPRLILVARADHRGRLTKDALLRDDPAGAWLKAETERLRVHDEKPTPILMGRHLLDRGHRPGKSLGAILARAFDAQLEGTFDSLDGALSWIDEHFVREDDS